MNLQEDTTQLRRKKIPVQDEEDHLGEDWLNKLI